LRRLAIVVADADDLWHGADREKNLRQVRHERHDALWSLAVRDRRSENRERDRDDCKTTGHVRLTRSQRKNGAPMSAVITPTGISIGENTVRAARSHPMSSAAPSSAAPGSTSRWSAPTHSRTACGTTIP